MTVGSNWHQVQDRRNQRGRVVLPCVPPTALTIGTHQLTQHFGTSHHRHEPGTRYNDFRISAFTADEITTTSACATFRACPIATEHRSSRRLTLALRKYQNLVRYSRDCALPQRSRHTDTADPDEMNGPDREAFPSCHNLLPAHVSVIAIAAHGDNLKPDPRVARPLQVYPSDANIRRQLSASALAATAERRSARTSCECILLDDPSAPGITQSFGIRSLVIVRRVREGNQERRSANDSVCYCRGPCGR